MTKKPKATKEPKSQATPAPAKSIDLPVAPAAAAAAPLPGDNAFAQAQSGQMAVGDLLGAAAGLSDAGRNDLAVVLYRTWLAHTDSPIAYAVHFNLGVVLGNLNDAAGAEAEYRQAIAKNPLFIQAHLNLGTQLERQGRPDEALEQWRGILKLIKPDTAENKQFTLLALNNLGRLLEIRKRNAEAEAALKQSLMLKPDQPDAITHWVHLRQKQCEWPVYKPFGGLKKADMLKSTSALAMLGVANEPEMQLFAARAFVDKKIIKDAAPLSDKKGYQHKKLRIGYLSSDLCSHAVSILAVELFELHDRERFEVFAFSWSREDGTPLRKRVVAAFDHYVPIGAMTDEQAAQLIRSHEIDVLVDLQGLTAGTRPNILAYRPAPLQLTYLGFPGPTAMPGVDYVLADRFVLPEELAPYFVEKPLYMPNSFQINDRKRAIGPKPTRAANNLPEDAFVFCSFNNNFKFTPEVFAVWMRILKRVPDALLWIVADSDEVRENLSDFAKKAGVDPARLVFAGRVQPADYLARYQIADLFLDTVPFNAGTTASDALWAGLPLLTCAGKTFSSRMAGSLLMAADLPELVTHSLEEYEEKAVALANDRATVEGYKKKLAETRDTCALFDSPRFVKDFENLLEGLVRTTPETRPDAEIAAKAGAPIELPVYEQPADDIILILCAEDIPMAQLVAQNLARYRTIVVDPGLLDKLLESGLENAEYVDCSGGPGFVALHDDARRRALQIEQHLLQGVQHLMPAVDNMGWNHLDFYYFLIAHRWYSHVAGVIARDFAGKRLHVLVNDNPLGFYWPSYVPGITLLERLNVAGVEFQAHSYGVRADETHVVPMLVGENQERCDVLAHLPTCMHDTAFLEEELRASGKRVFHIHPKYWGIPLTAERDINLVNIADVLAIFPPAFGKRVEEFKTILMARLDAVMREFISTEHHRFRQVEHLCDLYRAQFITYCLLNTYFTVNKPGKILLSDHDSGFHGPLVSFAEAHDIPVLLFPHSKTTPDIQFARKAVTVLTHPIQGQRIFDNVQKLANSQPLAYPETFKGSTRPVGKLKRLGVILNALSLNGVPNTDYPVFADGIKRIADWCREHDVELALRGRPGMPMLTLLEADAGIDAEACRAATAMPLADYAASIDACLMYDAPTTAELEFLRINVAIINTVPEPLSKYEAVINNTKVIPQYNVRDTLFELDSFLDDPLNLQAFRLTQFGDYLALFRGAKPLRSLL